MFERIRTIAARLTGNHLAPRVERVLPEVPFYAENWGTCQLGGKEVSRGVLVVVTPDGSSPLHGMELQLHRYDAALRLSISFCPRPPMGADDFASRVKCLGFPLSTCSSCPLGRRLEFLQEHLKRGFAGGGPGIAFEPTERSLRKLFRGMRGAKRLIPNDEAREAVASLLERVLLHTPETAAEPMWLSTLTLPPLPKS